GAGRDHSERVQRAGRALGPAHARVAREAADVEALVRETRIPQNRIALVTRQREQGLEQGERMRADPGEVVGGEAKAVRDEHGAAYARAHEQRLSIMRPSSPGVRWPTQQRDSAEPLKLTPLSEPR